MSGSKKEPKHDKETEDLLNSAKASLEGAKKSAESNNQMKGGLYRMLEKLEKDAPEEHKDAVTRLVAESKELLNDAHKLTPLEVQERINKLVEYGKSNFSA